MAGYGEPRDAIVSLWSDNSFLGSGAFIAPRTILTAKHVVEQRNTIAVHLVAGGYESVVVQKVHAHPTCDIALLDLGRDYTKQGLVALDCATSALEQQSVDLHGVNPDTYNRDTCKDYTLGTWDAAKRCYLFDHAQRKGFSGGIVVCNNIAVGVMTDRHTKEQQGAMVPLFEVQDWLQDLRGALKIPSLASPPVSQNRFTEHVRVEITALFATLPPLNLCKRRYLPQANQKMCWSRTQRPSL